MIVGTVRMVLLIQDAHSLKEKRRVLKGIKDRVFNKFRVSVAEVGHHDVWQTAELGFACVGNEVRHVNSVLSNVVSFVESNPRVRLVDYELEMI